MFVDDEKVFESPCCSQCGNCVNLLLTSICKNYAKLTHLVMIYSVICFHELFFNESKFLGFSTLCCCLCFNFNSFLP